MLAAYTKALVVTIRLQLGNKAGSDHQKGVGSKLGWH